MSIVRCDSCNRQVDTDKDTECAVSADEIMCSACRVKAVADYVRMEVENHNLKEANRRFLASNKLLIEQNGELRAKAIGSDASRFDEHMGVRRHE